MFNEIPEFKGNNLTQAYPNDFGYDIRSAESVRISPGFSHNVCTGLHICLPPYLGAIVQSRSGMAIRHSIECSNGGVIDCGYTSEIHVKIYNQSLYDPWDINIGDRIAQLCLHIKPAGMAEMLELFFKNKDTLIFKIEESDMATWPDYGRGINGVGSSGMK